MVGPSRPVLGHLLLVGLLLTAGNVSVDAVYPNPVTPGDAGEFVVLEVPDHFGERNLTLTDGEDSIALPNIETGQRVAIAGNATVAHALFDLPVYEVEDPLALSNNGERVSVKAGDRTLDSLTYPAAPEAELYRAGTWIRPGRSSVPPIVATDVPVSTFALPDHPRPVHDRIRAATDRVLVGGYTFTDRHLTRALIAAHERGVEVRVLLEGGPVGGITSVEAQAVRTLREHGIEVRFMGGERARYDYHHAKYAVIDGALFVTSENWEPGGTGGHGSRGWAVTLRDREMADQVAALFRADTAWRDAQPWRAVKPADPTFERAENTSYPARYGASRFRADRATVLVAPDNAGRAISRRLRNASERVWIQQVSIDPDGELLNETIAAARRGVSVRVLVSGAWFVESENRKLVERLRNLSRDEALPIRARVVEPRRRFEYVHNKGVVIDGRTVVVGSINWNPHSLRENRELAVMIEDPAVAGYYQRIYRADWRGAAWRVPWGFVVIVALALFAGLGVASRIGRFDDVDRDGDRVGSENEVESRRLL